MNTTSLTLLHRVKDPNDAEAWKRFVDLYTPLIRAYARKKGLDADDVEDVVQDCMEVLVKQMPKFTYSPELGRFKAYVRTLTSSRISNMYRRRRPRLAEKGELSSVESPESTDEAEWDKIWLHSHLEYCLRELESQCDEKSVQAFRLYALKGWPAEKVCAELNMNPNQLYQTKSRLMQRLRIQMRRLVGDFI